MTTAEEQFVRANLGNIPIASLGNIILLAALLKVSPETILQKSVVLQNEIREFVFMQEGK